MNELMKAWLYLNSTRILYLSMKSGFKYESVLWDCYTDIYHEIMNKYKGTLISTKNGYVGKICSIYSDSPVITIEDDYEMTWNVRIDEIKLL